MSCFLSPDSRFHSDRSPEIRREVGVLSAVLSTDTARKPNITARGVRGEDERRARRAGRDWDGDVIPFLARSPVLIVANDRLAALAPRDIRLGLL